MESGPVSGVASGHGALSPPGSSLPEPGQNQGLRASGLHPLPAHPPGPTDPQPSPDQGARPHPGAGAFNGQISRRLTL